MKAKIIKDTKIIDYPFLTITKDTIVEVIGESTSEGTIVVRINLGTDLERNALIKYDDLEMIENE